MTDRRELPTYTISEAAHYLSVPAAKIRYWSVGRGDHLPLIEVPSPSSPTLVSFLNLTELHVLSALPREHKVKMPAVRDAIEYLSRLATTSLDRRHSLVSRVLETDGLHVFTDYYGQLINLSRSGQAVIREVIAGALKRIERDWGGIPIKLYPFTRYSIRNAPATSRCPGRLGHGRVAAGHQRPDRASNSRASLRRLRCHVAAESNATEARVILLRWQRLDSGCFPIASQFPSV